jgi:hypothetical protein
VNIFRRWYNHAVRITSYVFMRTGVREDDFSAHLKQCVISVWHVMTFPQEEQLCVQSDWSV